MEQPAPDADDRGEIARIAVPVGLEMGVHLLLGMIDQVIVCPLLKGEPYLNHLHIPPHTSQSAHTHPSRRVGFILRGAGECRTPEGTFAPAPGLGWRIPAGCEHSFFTTDASLDVIA